jgi:uncharacterized protein YecE (DUF72 family)
MVHVGALLDRAPGRKYVGALRFAEFTPRSPLPRPGTLASMRRELPEGFALALRAPRAAVVGARGALRPDAELEAGLTWLKAAADALAVQAVVFSTPVDLTPGGRSRELLRDYVKQLPRVEGRHYVWSAQGAWEPEETHALCEELGLVRAFDPLETAATPGSVVYATLRALGHRSGFSLSVLADALQRTLTHRPDEVFIAVDAERGFDIARRLQTLANEAFGIEDDGAAQHEDEADGDEDEDSDDEDVDEEDDDVDA